MKYNIVDSKILVNQKLVEFQDTANKLNIEINTRNILAHLDNMLLLEEYIKYTKKTVRLNSLKKRLHLAQSKVVEIVYNSHKYDMFEVLNEKINNRMNEYLTTSLDNFASIKELNI